jgi:hypothetical protein
MVGRQGAWHFRETERMTDVSRAAHWRQRAEELRTIAESMRNRSASETLFQLATELDGMAERLERREKPKG